MSTYFDDILALRRYQDGCCVNCGRHLHIARIQAGKYVCGECDTSEVPRPTHRAAKASFAVRQDGEVDHGE